MKKDINVIFRQVEGINIKFYHTLTELTISFLIG